jgi:hypothetical protein
MSLARSSFCVHGGSKQTAEWLPAWQTVSDAHQTCCRRLYPKGSNEIRHRFLYDD